MDRVIRSCVQPVFISSHPDSGCPCEAPGVVEAIRAALSLPSASQYHGAGGGGGFLLETLIKPDTLVK